MNRKQYGLLLVVSMIMSLLGGMMTNVFFRGTDSAYAQQNKVIRATRVEIVDTFGNVRASLGYEGIETYLTLLGKDCGVQVKADKEGNPTLQLWQKSSNGTCTALLDASAVVFYDVDGELRSVFRQPYDKYQNAFIVFMDRSRNVVWQANLAQK